MIQAGLYAFPVFGLYVCFTAVSYIQKNRRSFLRIIFVGVFGISEAGIWVA